MMPSLFIFLSGTFIGSLFFLIFHRIKLGSYQNIARDILRRAEADAEIAKTKLDLTLKKREIDLQVEFETLLQKERKKLKTEQEKLNEKEERLESKLHSLEKKISETEKKQISLCLKESEIEKEQNRIFKEKEQLRIEIEKISGITREEAKKNLYQETKASLQKEIASLSHHLHKQAEEEAEKKACKIIATAINRLALSTSTAATTTIITLPNDEMKGRIIGKEGRNIRTLEKVTGVTVMIDETSSAIVLSGFDPIRREVAKVAINELISDGRIHPTRIEEAVEKASKTVQQQIQEHGQDAAIIAGAMNLHPELTDLLGKLKFRYSYGQNVLNHSLEVSTLMGIMAAELHLDVNRAKRIGLLHDIGKAVSHTVDGSHALIGYDFALKFGETEEVANGIGCHHGEMEPQTVEAWLCSAADKISGARTGARIGAVEEYTKRLKKLEEIAYEFPGVEKAYAMQGGQQICVAVFPEMVDDVETAELARKLTKRIEEELSYPGKIKVTVIREKRAVEYAKSRYD